MSAKTELNKSFFNYKEAFHHEIKPLADRVVIKLVEEEETTKGG